MCWGIECGDGWYDLIDALCADIQNEVDNEIRQQGYKIKRGDLKPEDALPEEDMQVVAVQVKEKFGGLRFYVSRETDRVAGMISMAESMSLRICETCGNPGRPNKQGWITTMCTTCRDAYEKKRAEARDEWERRFAFKK